MSEISAPCRLAANAVVTGAIMIDQALVLSDCLSRTKHPRSIQLPVMNSILTTNTSLGRPSQEPK